MTSFSRDAEPLLVSSFPRCYSPEFTLSAAHLGCWLIFPSLGKSLFLFFCLYLTCSFFNTVTKTPQGGSPYTGKSFRRLIVPAQGQRLTPGAALLAGGTLRGHRVPHEQVHLLASPTAHVASSTELWGHCSDAITQASLPASEHCSLIKCQTSYSPQIITTFPPEPMGTHRNPVQTIALVVSPGNELHVLNSPMRFSAPLSYSLLTTVKGGGISLPLYRGGRVAAVMNGGRF